MRPDRRRTPNDRRHDQKRFDITIQIFSITKKVVFAMSFFILGPLLARLVLKYLFGINHKPAFGFYTFAKIE